MMNTDIGSWTKPRDKGSAHRMFGPIAQLKVLTDMRDTENMVYTDIDIFILRDLGFTHKCRDLPYNEMVKFLITAITPLAVAERLLK